MKKFLKYFLFSLLLLLIGLSIWGAWDLWFYKFSPVSGGTYVTVGGIPIHYRQNGEGPDILLVHGAPGLIEDWDSIQPELAKHFRVTVMERPGHGFSGEAVQANLAENTRAVFGVVHELDLKDVTLVGHSYGGTTALSLATQNPPEISRYVAIGAPPFSIQSKQWAYYLLKVPWLGRGAAKLLAPLIGEHLVKKGIQASFGLDKNLIPSGFIEKRQKFWLNPKVMTTAAREVLALDGELALLREQYKQIVAPVLLLAGEQDRNYTQNQQLHKSFPQLQLQTFPQAGHYLQVERPQEVIQAMINFYSQTENQLENQVEKRLP